MVKVKLVPLTIPWYMEGRIKAGFNFCVQQKKLCRFAVFSLHFDSTGNRVFQTGNTLT